MSTILFHSNQLGLRGTEVALYGYAHYNQTLLKNRSVIVYNRAGEDNNSEVVERFSQLFPVHAYDDFAEVDRIAACEGADMLYVIKWGFRDGIISQTIPTLVHSVFPTPLEEVHGDVYAYISDWLSQELSGGTLPVVPHMIDLPNHNKTLHAKLGIPRDALVRSSYGGETSFDVPFAPDCLAAALEHRSDLYALFMNYPRFLDHKRAFFFAGSPNREFKTAFVNTCDAMIHARLRGETFGLAIGEFSSRNRAVLTCGGSPERAHLDILKDKALVYESAVELGRLLQELDKATLRQESWDCFSPRYAPAPVMERFQRVFLAGVDTTAA